jgi:hypothetical protein
VRHQPLPPVDPAAGFGFNQWRALLLRTTLDLLAAEHPDNGGPGCCRGCCPTCDALSTMAERDLLDQYMQAFPGRLPGGTWWDTQHQQVDRAWLGRACANPCDLHTDEGAADAHQT